MSAEDIADDILMAAWDDWVLGTQFAEFGRERLPGLPPAEQRAATVAVIERLVTEGLLEVGEPKQGFAGFDPWPGTPAELAARLLAAWSALDGDPVPGDIGWLNATPAGHQLGDQLLTANGRPPRPAGA
jgi:hypothetical protein